MHLGPVTHVGLVSASSRLRAAPGDRHPQRSAALEAPSETEIKPSVSLRGGTAAGGATLADFRVAVVVY